MSFDKSLDVFEGLVAKSADVANKPFFHSVINSNGKFNLQEDDIDLTLNILCRYVDGSRLKKYDIQLELFSSNGEFVVVLASLYYPDDPILWCGNKNLWMDSRTGKKCKPPNYGFRLENLANRIKNLF